MLDMVEGEVLGRKFIEELLAMVDQGQVENTAHLAAERERLREEVQNLVGSIAAGVPADTVAPGIRARELEISRLEARLRAPRPEVPRVEELRAALLQRAEDWRQTLRSEPAMARVLLRRLIGPLVLHDESQRPDFIEAVADVRTGLLDGLAPHKWWRPQFARVGTRLSNGSGGLIRSGERLESSPDQWRSEPNSGSWNRVNEWLHEIAGLRHAC